MSEGTTNRTLRQEIVEAEAAPLRHDIVAGGNDSRRNLAPETASQAITFAALMARSGTAVPQMFRNNQGLCLGVTMDAMTFGFNPFALARSAYEVGGAIGYEAKVYVAALNTSRFLKSRLRTSYTGKIIGTHTIQTKSGTRQAPAGDLKCKIVGHVVGEDELMEWESPELGQITTKNSPLWYSDARLQLFYYTVRSWTRVHVPEAMLGVRTTDELMDRDEPYEPPAPKQTLIERVKARRQEASYTTDETLPPPEKKRRTETEPVDVEAENVDVVAETASNPSASLVEPEPDPAPTGEASRSRRRKARTIAKQDDDAPAAENPVESPAPSADEPDRPKTPKEALDLLAMSVGESNSREEVEAAKAAWMASISGFSREDQFDLQARADEIAARRRMDLRRKDVRE